MFSVMGEITNMCVCLLVCSSGLELYVNKADLKPTILWSQSPVCQDYRCEPPCLVYISHFLHFLSFLYFLQLNV